MSTQKIELSPANRTKINIIERTIQEDQTAVATQWLDTFKHNAKDNAATQIAKLMVASIAQGDFKTKSTLASPDLSAPPNTLSVIDYVSHASRIVIDYKNLNPEHLKEFLAFFPQAGQKGVFARSATHAVVREGAKITELKGFMLGVTGQLPSFVKTPYDFGVNIAMGGEGQVNSIGNTISDNGFSGHVYFHHYAPDSLLMLGLEQSAPAASLLDAIWGHKSSAHGVQQDSDQFGQGHSLTGASDTYTAAGSLYFSDPIYQAKLLAETGTMPPDKYGAMQVTLTDENWSEIKQFLGALDTNLETHREDLVVNQLLTPPKTAIEIPQKIQSYIAIDFKAYFKGIAILLEQVPEEQRTAVKEKVKALQTELLISIQALQEGHPERYRQFQQQIKMICALDSLPENYTKAVQRIKGLFTLQQQLDPTLKETYINILIEQRCSELLDAITGLQEKAMFLREYFSSEHISQENGVGIFLSNLEELSQSVNKIKLRLVPDAQSTSIDKYEPENSNLNDSIIKQNSLESSWLKFSPLSLKDLALYQDEIQKFGRFLKHTPRLVSESSLSKALKSIDDYQHIIQKQEQELSALQLCFETHVREANLKNTEFERTKTDLFQIKNELSLLEQQLKEQQQKASSTIVHHLKTIDSQGLESQKKIDELRSKISIEAKHHDRVEKELRKQISALEQKRDESKCLLETQTNKIKQQQQQITLLNSELERIAFAQKQTALAFEALKSESSTEKELLQKNLVLQVEKTNATQESLNQLQEKMEIVRQENERLSVEALSFTSTTQKLTEKVVRLERQLESKTQEALQLVLQVAEMENNLFQAKTKHELDLKSFDDQKSVSSQKILELTRQIQETDKEHQGILSELKSQLNLEQQRHKTLEMQLLAEMEHYKSQQSSLYEASQNQVLKLKEELVRLRQENENLVLQIKKKSKLPQEEREMLYEQLRSQQEKIVNAEELSARLKGTEEQLQTENQLLHSEIRKLTNALHSMESELTQLKMKLTDSEKLSGEERKHLLDEVQIKERNLISAKQQFEELKATLGKTQQANAALNEENQSLRLKDRQYQEHIARLEIRMQELQIEQSNNLTPAMKQALIGLAPVFIQLINLEEQSRSLLRRGHIHEYTLAAKLAVNIRKEIDIYLTHVDKPTEENALAQLKINCGKYIEKVTPDLEVHRGWKQILGNLAACIAGLGVGYAIAGIINKLTTGHFFFFNQTKSMKAVNGLQSSLNEFESANTLVPVKA